MVRSSQALLLRAFLLKVAESQRTGTINLLLSLNRRVRDEINFVTRLEHGIQTSEETLQKRSGSCRDSALLLVECLPGFGNAALFVSGYLIQLAAEKSESPGSNGGPASRLCRPCMPGLRLSYRAQDGLDWTPLRAFSSAKAISRWPALQVLPKPPQSREPPSGQAPTSATKCPFAA